VVDDGVAGLVGDVVLHPVVFAHLFEDGEVVLDEFSALAEGGDAVADFVDEVGEHEDA